MSQPTKKSKIEQEPCSIEILDKDSRNFLRDVIFHNNFYYALNAHVIENSFCCGEIRYDKPSLIVCSTQERVIEIEEKIIQWFEKNKEKYDLKIFDSRIDYTSSDDVFKRGKLLTQEEIKAIGKKELKPLSLRFEKNFFLKKDLLKNFRSKMASKQKIPKMIDKFDDRHFINFFINPEPENEIEREWFQKINDEIKESYLR